MAFPGTGSCDHVGFFTNDSARLVRFYRDELGFILEKEELLPASIMRPIFGLPHPCRLIKLSAATGKPAPHPPLKIEIFHPVGLRLPRRRNGIVGCNHCSFTVGDKKRFLRKIRSRGVPLIEVGRNGHSVFFIKDPDGNRIEIRD
jgi:catechol 2,3-dioxygenase-like lactoylglutathione lyase family enzyme